MKRSVLLSFVVAIISASALSACDPPPPVLACTASQLKINPGARQTVAGDAVYQDLLFTNVSLVPCTLYGWPSVTAVESAYSPVDQARHASAGLGKTILLAPGGAAQATVRGQTTGIYPGRTAYGLLVAPPGSTVTTLVNASLPMVGGLDVYPVTAPGQGRRSP